MVTDLFLVCSTLICRWREQLQMELLLKDIFGVTFIFFDGCWEQFLVYLALVCRWKNVTTSNRITLTTRFKIVKTRPKSPKRIMVWMLIKVRLGYTYPSPTLRLSLFRKWWSKFYEYFSMLFFQSFVYFLFQDDLLLKISFCLFDLVFITLYHSWNVTSPKLT